MHLDTGRFTVDEGSLTDPVYRFGGPHLSSRDMLSWSGLQITAMATDVLRCGVISVP